MRLTTRLCRSTHLGCGILISWVVRDTCAVLHRRKPGVHNLPTTLLLPRLLQMHTAPAHACGCSNSS